MSRIDPKIYLREVFGHVVDLSEEGSDTSEQMKGDDMMALMLQGAMDAVIEQSMPAEGRVLIDAMRMAEITAEQAAKVIIYTGYKANRLAK